MSAAVIGAPVGAPPRRRWARLLLRVLLAAVVCLLAWFACVAVRIVHQGNVDEAGQADAIVVFGAAEYSGHPSPVLRARLDHAYDLYSAKLAPIVITTGGAAWDPQFTEGGVGHDYLLKKGIPDHALIAETHAVNTEESADRVAVILRANGLKNCIAVSDPVHVFRIKKMLLADGIDTRTSPRQKFQGRWYEAVWRVTREAVAYMAWHVGL